MPTFCLPALAVLAGLAGSAWSQGGIYTCVDAKGRRLTSDRPNAECLDREQKVLNSRGLVQRTLPPSLTAAERAALEEQERRAADERQRQAEEKRLQRALLTRYPNQAVHDGERAKALQTVQEAIAAGQRRIGELRAERAKLNTETEFYKSPASYPVKLKRQIDDLEHQLALQQRSVATQEEEKRRISARFDEELARLAVLWSQAQGTAAASAPSAAPMKR